MRVLVTGSRGFVGGWLLQYLRDEGDEVIELSEGLDLRDRSSMSAEIEGLGIDLCYHLAALSHVGDSWSQPEEYFSNNVIGTASLVSMLMSLRRPPRLIHVSSSEVYGRVSIDDLPIVEAQPLHPVSPYAASKAASEIAALQAWYGRGLEVLVVRPFNHTGPGQSPNFLVPALVARVVAARAAGTRSIRVGNIQAKRDFLDVRDVVRAYRSLAVHGRPGEMYNVCSGQPVSVEEIIEMLFDILDYRVELEVDERLLRPNDVSVVAGDPAKLMAETGFRPRFAMRETIGAMVARLADGSRPSSSD